MKIKYMYTCHVVDRGGMIGPHTKNESNKMVDIVNRLEASQCAFLNSFNLLAGTSLNIIVIFILHKFSQETNYIN